jgi:hypothetical protein
MRCPLVFYRRPSFVVFQQMLLRVCRQSFFVPLLL